MYVDLVKCQHQQIAAEFDLLVTILQMLVTNLLTKEKTQVEINNKLTTFLQEPLSYKEVLTKENNYP